MNVFCVISGSVDLCATILSQGNLLAVALGSFIYLWNAGTGEISQLCGLEGEEYVCSVRWVEEGTYLAVGSSSGNCRVVPGEKPSVFALD